MSRPQEGWSQCSPSYCTSTKVHHVTPSPRENLGEDEDWLRDVVNEMEIEDSAI